MKYEVLVQGDQPLILHKYTPETISKPIIRLTGLGEATNYSDEWIKGSYTIVPENGDKNAIKTHLLVMPSTNILACLFEGAKGMKAGKTSLTRRLYTSIEVSPLEPLITLDNKPISILDVATNNWLLTTGAVVRGARIDRIRTQLPPGWQIKFQIVPLNEDLGIDHIKAILERAGRYSGLGDWRPSSPKKPGPYGVFSVVSFDEIG